MLMNLGSIARAALVVSICLTLAGCQSPGTGGSPATAFSDTPIASDHAVVMANGLSCPLCANNIDSILKKVPGVTTVNIDLEKGAIHIGLTGGVRPSKARLAKAVTDAGFTVVSVN
jgi:copper chaperone CopZ